jgi:type IV pilus assembly protein PilC
MAGIDIRKLNTTYRNTDKAGNGAKNIFAFLEKDIVFFKRELSDKKKERFYSELKILFAAGVDLKTALDLLVEEQTKKEDKQLFQSIKQNVIEGSSLSEAIVKTNKFSAYEFYTIQIGEETGHLSEVLNDLSAYFSGKITQKRQVINALSYPVLVLFTAFGAIFFMLKYVVPMFADVFKRFNTDLPSITKFIIRLSDAFSNYTFYPFLFLCIGIGIAYSQRKKQWYKHYSSSIILKIPVLGEIVGKVYLERFCRSMNLLIASKTQLINAIGLSAKMIDFYPIATSLEIVKQDIMKGVSLHESLSKYEIYNKRMISLVRVAEEVNQLDVIFGKLSQQYSDEIKHSTAIISSLLEPLMIVFLGLLVAIILVAMYLPLFRLGSAIH